MKKLLSGCALVVCLATCVWDANAQTTYSALENVANFGWLDQREPEIVEATGRNGCNPTSWVNLMVKLQNQYPDTFQTALVGATYEDWIQSAVSLSGPSYLNTTPTEGTDSVNITSGMESYFQSKGFFDFSVTKYTYPRMVDLYQSALLSATVQLLLAPLPGSTATIGHAVSFGGFNWTNTNNLSYVIEADNATISFVDPQDPLHGAEAGSGAGFASAHAWDAFDGTIYFSIAQYAGNDYFIHSAYAVVPEPTTFHCFIFGTLALLFVVSRRMKIGRCSPATKHPR
ncbi:MAG: hypothetical protein WCI38_11340 [Chthoniobacterales bacterium]